jgi:hypothetical protein
VPVEDAAGAVVVLRGPRVGMPGEDLRVPDQNAGSRALVIAACRSECGLTCRGVPADFAPAAPSGGSRVGRSACPTAATAPAAPPCGGRGRPRGAGAPGSVSGMAAGLVPLPTGWSTRCPRSVSW